MRITLSEQEWEDASSWARLRAEDSRRRGLQDRYGAAGRDTSAGTERERTGVHGEMVVACYLSVSTFEPSVGSFARADIGRDIQVRGRSEPWHDLIVRSADEPGQRFVLVTPSSAGSRAFDIRGWIYTSEAWRREWYQRHGGRAGAFFVPQAALHPPETLTLDPPGAV